MLVSDLVAAMEAIAPTHLAESWDNVGLLLGDRSREVRGPVMLTIDLTPQVMDEALDLKAGAIVAYHPPLFSAVKSITADTSMGRSLLRALESGMAVYSPHSALDATTDGVTDWLAEGLGKGDRRAIVPSAGVDPRQTHKVVTFVPAEHVERLRNALASAGAGRIGEYELCSFTVRGMGTFRGSEKSRPVVGSAGQLEEVEEVRLEMVCPGDAAPILIETLRAFHPYEEPAFDVYPLAGKPDRRVGAGRRLVLDQPATPSQLAMRLRDYLGIERVRLADVLERPVERVGVVPGAGASLLDEAIAQGCEVFVTGEMRHHDMLKAMSKGCCVILGGHTNTERGYMPRLAEKLKSMGTDGKFVVSRADRVPWRNV